MSKVKVKSGKYTNIPMGTFQAEIAHGLLDTVRAGDVPMDQVEHDFHQLGLKGEL